MAIIVVSSGTVTAVVGIEQTLYSSGYGASFAGSYRFDVDLANLQSGDALELRIYSKVLLTGTERLSTYAIFSGAQADPLPAYLQSIVFSTPWGVKCTLKQTTGSARNFDWSVNTL